MSFLKEYFRHPFLIGAVTSSSHWLARKMLQDTGIASCRCVVEYGPGTGVFTKEIVKQKRPECPLLSIEQNPIFYEQLKRRFADDPSVHILHGSAVDVKNYLGDFGLSEADLVISGLPFATLPHSLSADILSNTAAALAKDGRFVTFQYTLFKRRLFEEHFQIMETLFELRNLPAAFILVMERKG